MFEAPRGGKEPAKNMRNAAPVDPKDAGRHPIGRKRQHAAKLLRFKTAVLFEKADQVGDRPKVLLLERALQNLADFNFLGRHRLHPTGNTDLKGLVEDAF